MTPDIKTHIWVAALIRRAAAAGAGAVVARKGDPDAGAVVVKVARLDGTARLYAPARDGAGERVFLDLADGATEPDEAAIDQQLRARTARDPDLWVIEIEDREGRPFLTERIDGGSATGR